MGMKIPLTYMTETVGDDGQPTIAGKLGRARLIGRVHGYNENDERVWSIAIEEPDKEAEKRKKFYRERKRRERREREAGLG